MTAVPTEFPAGRRFGDRIGDNTLKVLTGAAGVGVVVLIGAIAWKVIDGSTLSFSEFGLGFLVHSVWDPVHNDFGALSFIYGTAVTSFIALLLATPLAIGIALYLTELAPRAVREVIGALVEMLAAIPSVILGPFMLNHLEPWLQSFLGWLPLVRGSPDQKGILPAAIILTIMAVPIIASVARELFISVPDDLKDGARALGATRWEVVRGDVLQYTRAGLGAAVILGLGRALGEAIAVTQVVGGTVNISRSLFASGDTLASRIAAQYAGFETNLQLSSLFYLAVILLVFSLIINLIAQLIVRRFEFQRTGGT